MLANLLHTHPRRLITGLLLFSISCILTALLVFTPMVLSALAPSRWLIESFYKLEQHLFDALALLKCIAPIAVACGLHASVRGGSRQPFFRTAYLLAAFLGTPAVIILRHLYPWISPFPYKPPTLTDESMHILSLVLYNLTLITLSALTLRSLSSLAYHTAASRYSTLASHCAVALFVLDVILGIGFSVCYWSFYIDSFNSSFGPVADYFRIFMLVWAVLEIARSLLVLSLLPALKKSLTAPAFPIQPNSA